MKCLGLVPEDRLVNVDISNRGDGKTVSMVHEAHESGTRTVPMYKENASSFRAESRKRQKRETRIKMFQGTGATV